MTESDKLLALILNIGVEMIECGAETHRVEDSLYRICENYNFSDCGCFANYSRSSFILFGLWYGYW